MDGGCKIGEGSGLGRDVDGTTPKSVALLRLMVVVA